MKKSLNKIISDKQAMYLAIKEAKKGQGFVLPNPPVGCVILSKNRTLLSSGFYSHYGSLHAEISALNKIADKNLLEGAHLFVTLEPCSHFGQNPPCVDSLIKYPLTSVTYGIEDPNPKVKGQGLQKLKKRGFIVRKTEFFQNTIHRLYESFSLNMQENRTFFALKVACSLDGMLCLSHGDSQWITGKKSRHFISELRSEFDGVLIGIGTFLTDNPRLNIRKKGFENYSNKVCILDPSGHSLKLISKSNIACVRPLEKIFVITRKSIKKQAYPFRVLTANWNSNLAQFDLKDLSKQLYQEAGLHSLLIEGGARVFSSFLQQNQAQRLYQFINPCFIGGAKGRAWTEDLSIKNLMNKKSLKTKEIVPFSEDILITGIL